MILVSRSIRFVLIFEWERDLEIFITATFTWLFDFGRLRDFRLCVTAVKISVLCVILSLNGHWRIQESRAVAEKPHGAVVKFDRYWNLRRHHAVLPAVARLSYHWRLMCWKCHLVTAWWMLNITLHWLNTHVYDDRWSQPRLINEAKQASVDAHNLWILCEWYDANNKRIIRWLLDKRVLLKKLNLMTE